MGILIILILAIKIFILRLPNEDFSFKTSINTIKTLIEELNIVIIIKTI